MSHPLVQQLRFTRSEFKRGLKGLTDEEARRRFLPLNCISWNVGHLAWQEQRYFLFFAQGQMLLQQVNDQFAYGAPASTPPLASRRVTRLPRPVRPLAFSSSGSTTPYLA